MATTANILVIRGTFGQPATGLVCLMINVCLIKNCCHNLNITECWTSKNRVTTLKIFTYLKQKLRTTESTYYRLFYDIVNEKNIGIFVAYAIIQKVESNPNFLFCRHKVGIIESTYSRPFYYITNEKNIDIIDHIHHYLESWAQSLRILFFMKPERTNYSRVHTLDYFTILPMKRTFFFHIFKML